MRATTRAAATLLAAALAAATVVGATAPASAVADLTTRCSGTAGAVTIPGDLVVPAGASCVLNGTVVIGDTRIAANASLITTDATFGGEIRLVSGAYLDAVNTSVSGRIVNRDGYGIYLEKSSVSDVITPPSESSGTFLTAFDTQLTSVRTESGALLLEATTVTGNVTSATSTYTDILDSWVTGSVTVSAAQLGTIVCGSEIDRNFILEDNGGVQIGAGDLLATCDDAVYIGGSVTISGTSTGTTLGEVIIRGDLSGTDNVPEPSLTEVRVRGTIAGQFAQATPNELSLNASRTATGPRPDVEELALERRTEALLQAAQVGEASL